MITAMRVVLVACISAGCWGLAHSVAVAALPPQEPGVIGADGLFRKTGTEIGWAQAVRVAGTYRIKDDEVLFDKYCPSVGLAVIESPLPGFTSSGSIVQYNSDKKSVPDVQLANKSWRCGGEVRVELELRARVKRDVIDRNAAGCSGLIVPTRFPCRRTSSGCETRLGFCNINVYGELRLYEGTSSSTNNLRRRRAIDVSLVPILGTGFEDNYELEARAGDWVKMKLLITTAPTFVLQV